MSNNRIDVKADIGKMAIHICSNTVGKIISSDQDENADCWNWLKMEGANRNTKAGHRHYFALEGGNYPGDKLFEQLKHKYFP